MKIHRSHSDTHSLAALLLASLACVCLAATAHALIDPGDSYGMVSSLHKIDALGDMQFLVHQDDRFGSAVASMGDIDGNGVPDLAAGSPNVDHVWPNAGGFFTLLLAADGSVLAAREVTNQIGGLVGEPLGMQDHFGCALASLGDLDGDGVDDLAVGSRGDDDSASGSGGDRGAVWILHMLADGTVKAQQKISDTSGGMTGQLADHGWFGASLATLGDLDGDGVTDLAVGAPADASLGTFGGALWVLFLKVDGTVKAHVKITEGSGGFPGGLESGDMFGWSLAALRDGPALRTLVVGAPGDDDGDNEQGAVWLLDLDATGTVTTHGKISATSGGFGGQLESNDRFGTSAADVGDLDGDGIGDLAVGAIGDVEDFPTSGYRRGAAWLLFLAADGSVRMHQKISEVQGGFSAELDDLDEFGCAVSMLGDVDGDGIGDLAVGASHDLNRYGAVYVLFLRQATPWTDHGNALAGTHGAPLLSGGGTLVPGEAYTLDLTNALENTLAFYLVGVDTLYTPLINGGWIVPDSSPPGFIVALSTGPAGSIQIASNWPLSLPVGSRLYFQAWLQDPGGTFGKASTNALGATTQ